ncbi:LysR family transcriptional regulator [Embleya scabrispora]|uniref:LysR family transcriptional regulator n=1 Tax=Embleya scabrispora TaxID=159449 RepID=UPI000364E862|nr:LysR family transcriptional regulator [Embleya scabrispora]MYS82970.1 LysR family transcriptional regulator [Streptomyces sp. SID5474]
MELRDLRCFLAVAEERHFGRAAARLYLSQPMVSKAVRRLEQQLGARLVDRSSLPVALTPLGEVFRSRLDESLRVLDDACAEVRRRATWDAGQVRVGYTSGLGPSLVSAAISALHIRHPALRVQWTSEPTARQVADVREGVLDAGLGWLPDLGPGFESARVGTFAFVALLPQEHALAGRLSVNLPELVGCGEPIVVWPRQPHPRLYSRVTEALRRSGATEIVEAYGSVDDVIARVVDRQGVGLSPRGWARQRPVRGVVQVPLTGAPDVAVTAFWRADQEHEGVGVLVQLLREVAADSDLADQL